MSNTAPIDHKTDKRHGLIQSGQDVVPPKTEAEGQDERRRAFRCAFIAAAVVTELQTHLRVEGRCSDLSQGGCYVDTINPLPQAAVVNVRIERGSLRFDAVATVAFNHFALGMGLEFTEIKEVDRSQLQTWLANADGERPPEPEVKTSEVEFSALSAMMNMQQVMNEMIMKMIQKKIIAEQEGAELLRKIYR